MKDGDCMPRQVDAETRRKEVIDISLRVFAEKGLLTTSSRELSAALNMQNAAIYYYFKSKDDLVIACAEEAAFRLENQLIAPLVHQLNNIDDLFFNLQIKADEMASLMRFLVKAFATPKYHEKLIPTLDGISKRYKKYAEMFAEVLDADISLVEPYVYMGITAATNYMIFGDNSFIKPQFDLIKAQLKQLQSRK